MSNFSIQIFSCNSYVQVPPTYSIKLLYEDNVANVRLVEGDERLSNCKNRKKNYERHLK